MEHHVVRVLLLALVFVAAVCSSDDKTGPSPVQGSTIFKMGRKYNKPFWRLVGKALADLDCRSNGCEPWADWSPCKVYPGAGQFGVQKRVRQCGTNSACPSTNPYNETDIRVCQDFCPADYEVTPEGFCLKFYNKTTKNKMDAESSCQANGGHLVNINSPIKWNAFASLMQKYGYKGGVHIDGERKSSSSPWTFSYETDQSGYTNWVSSEPSNSSTELCLYGYISSSSYGIGDAACSTSRYYVCENIPVM